MCSASSANSQRVFSGVGNQLTTTLSQDKVIKTSFQLIKVIVKIKTLFFMYLQKYKKKSK